jgi:class 3 adenylate cyclase
VLVVDDDRSIRDLAGAALRGGDFEVTTAASGDEAVGRLDGGFDIVVTDLDMPGSVNGLQLTQRVRRGSSVDVIIMTGFPDLATAIQAVREGAYDYLVKPFSPDTLKMAVDRCASARRLSKELERERALREELNRAYGELSRMQKVRDLFGQFITPEVAAFVLAHPNDFWARGERREVTVLFADVRGFTPYAARVDPETAVRTLNQLFEVLVGAVQEQGGVVNKFLGDGLMAVFGAPCALPGHAAAAVRAAIKARAVLSFSSPLENEGDRLSVGFALNSGDVLAGCLGARDRTEYSVIGSAVNVAARIEKLCGPGEILLGPDTARRGGEAFDLERRGPVLLPGFPDPVELCAVRGPKAGAFC